MPATVNRTRWCATETQNLELQLPAPRKSSKEQQKMANVKRLQQRRAKRRPALVLGWEKETLQKMGITASALMDVSNTHLKELFKYSRELREHNPPVLNAKLEIQPLSCCVISYPFAFNLRTRCPQSCGESLDREQLG